MGQRRANVEKLNRSGWNKMLKMKMRVENFVYSACARGDTWEQFSAKWEGKKPKSRSVQQFGNYDGSLMFTLISPTIALNSVLKYARKCCEKLGEKYLIFLSNLRISSANINTISSSTPEKDSRVVWESIWIAIPMKCERETEAGVPVSWIHFNFIWHFRKFMICAAVKLSGRVSLVNQNKS